MKLIKSRDNPFFKQLKRLAESGRERRQVGRTLLDGVHLIEAYETRLGAVDMLLVSESALAAEGEISTFVAGRELTVLGDALMRELGLVDTPSGILAEVSVPSLNLAVDFENNSILLDGVQDPGNVGTLLRTAAAAGIQQVLLTPGCAAAWSPKVLRAGQGAHFVLAIHEEVDAFDFLEKFRGTTAVTCLENAVSLYEADWHEPLTWVFGAEGRGVRPELIARAGLRVKIPMPGAVESLNVAAAAAICLFEGVRRSLIR